VSQGKLKTIYDQNILQAENNLCKKENQRLSKIREFCLRYFQICPVDSQPSLVSPWRAVVNANFRISHEAKISNELSFMDLFHFQAPLLLSSKDDKSARPIMVQSSLDYQSQLYESMSFNCHSPRNDKCLIFIFLISVGSHKSWRVLRLVTVRLHEILNLARTLFVFSKRKSASSFSYDFLCCLSNRCIPTAFTSPQQASSFPQGGRLGWVVQHF